MAILRRTRPRLSIGVPVYNGARHLGSALESLSAQTFGDYEVVISDNASTDETESICTAYARGDRRVRYLRQTENIGAGPNFNLTFHESSGEYFKWVAHDDLMEPTFLARCIAALDGDPGAVLAYPRTNLIDDNADPLGEYDSDLRTDAADPVMRLSELLLNWHRRYQVFGVIRREALERTPLIGEYSAGDDTLLARLALAGRFIEIPERLFLSRIHDGRSSEQCKNRYEYEAWFNPALEGKISLPNFRLGREYLRAVAESDLPLRLRLRCLAVLVRWGRLNRPRLKKDLKIALKALLSRGSRTRRILPIARRVRRAITSSTNSDRQETGDESSDISRRRRLAIVRGNGD